MVSSVWVCFICLFVLREEQCLNSLNYPWFFRPESNKMGLLSASQRKSSGHMEGKSNQVMSQGLIEILEGVTDYILERNTISNSLKLFLSKDPKEIIDYCRKKWMSETRNSGGVGLTQASKTDNGQVTYEILKEVYVPCVQGISVRYRGKSF